MPYVHLSNGAVKKVANREFNHPEWREKYMPAPHIWHEGGKQYPVIGVYPEEMSLAANESVAPDLSAPETTESEVASL